MKVLYFAWVRQKVGKGEEDMALSPGVSTIADLVRVLRSRGGGFAEAFADERQIRAARNQEHVGFGTKLDDTDEVAFFPPVTGG